MNQIKVAHYQKMYVAWVNMIGRCENANRPKFKDYGGRGISVCGRWRKSFQNFVNDMGVPINPLLSLDRKDNNGAYCRSNCRWATRTEQNRNQRRNAGKVFKN